MSDETVPLVGRIARRLRLWLWRLPGLRGPGAIENPPVPDIPVAIVGDIHGRADLLDEILPRIEQERPEALRVFVGDYVDRGPESRRVLSILRGLQNAVVLRGNHEEMMLEFLTEPIEKGGRWLRNGGEATLASFGIQLDSSASWEEIMAASAALRNALGDGTEDWLRSLPLYWRTGNLVVTHAGPNPALPIQGQADEVFLWGHNRFLRDVRKDGIWVAHGHWAHEAVTIRDSRIGVDTGAWRSGRLSAAVIGEDGQVRILQAIGPAA